MAKQVERARKAENRTRSELVREALRVYLSARLVPAELPTAAEARAYRRGMAAYKRGDYVTLEGYPMNGSSSPPGQQEKLLSAFRQADWTRILAAPEEMQENPFQGDIRKLQGLPGFRRLAYSLRGRTRAPSRGRRRH